METIGEKLKTSREESGLSLEEVAEDLKISVTDLENIENGNKSAFVDNYALKKYIYDYAKYLGLDYEQLIEEFNEFMFTYTSKIPVDVIERISKQKEEEEAKKQALSPYTARVKKKDNKLIFIVIMLMLAFLFTTIFIVINNNGSNNNNPTMALL